MPSDIAAVNVKIPRRTNRAVFSIFACGQIDEEQWFDNVFDSAVNTFPGYGPLFGGSPFRELQLYIDGMLAGVVWPFPIFFTGGIVPGLWRPIVGIDAFDLREDEIDITPWLGQITDGHKHTFEIRVAGISGDGSTKKPILEPAPSYWVSHPLSPHQQSSLTPQARHRQDLPLVRPRRLHYHSLTPHLQRARSLHPPYPISDPGRQRH